MQKQTTSIFDQTGNQRNQEGEEYVKVRTRLIQKKQAWQKSQTYTKHVHSKYKTFSWDFTYT